LKFTVELGGDLLLVGYERLLVDLLWSTEGFLYAEAPRPPLIESSATSMARYRAYRSFVEECQGSPTPIWVTPKPHGGYVVLDGCKTVPAVLDLKREHPGDPTWSTISCFVVRERLSAEQIQSIRGQALAAIRARSQ